MASKRSKTMARPPILIRQIDRATGMPIDLWATVVSGAVTGWTADPHAATPLTMKEAVAIQQENEKRPDATFMYICRDEVTLADPADVILSDHAGDEWRY